MGGPWAHSAPHPARRSLGTLHSRKGSLCAKQLLPPTPRRVGVSSCSRQSAPFSLGHRVCSHSVGPWEDAPGPPRRSSSCMAPRAGRRAWVQGHRHLLSEQLQTPSGQKEEASGCVPHLPLTTTELFLIRPRCSDPGAVKSAVVSGPRVTEAPSSFCFLRWVSRAERDELHAEAHPGVCQVPPSHRGISPESSAPGASIQKQA